MGHTFITCGGGHVHLHDVRILLLRHLFLRQLADAPPGSFGADGEELATLRRFFEAWEYAGPGVVMGTDLTPLVEGRDDRRPVLRRLFEQTARDLDRFGPAIPMGYLNRHADVADSTAGSPRRSRFWTPSPASGTWWIRAKLRKSAHPAVKTAVAVWLPQELNVDPPNRARPSSPFCAGRAA
jgi:hypothetical protein